MQNERGEDGTLHVRDAEVEYLAFLGLPVTETNLMQLRVFGEAMRVFHSRDPKYGGLWQDYPAADHLAHMRSKLGRSEANIDPDDMDDAIDLLNYTVFYVRTRRSEG